MREAAIGGGGPLNRMRLGGFVLENDPALLVRLLRALVDGEELRRSDEALRFRHVSGERSSSSGLGDGRGESSERSYSLVFFRIGGLRFGLWKGRPGPSLRERESRGRKEDFPDIVTPCKTWTIPFNARIEGLALESKLTPP